MNATQLDRMTNAKGFIAALDQSGGSTPTALAHYGIDASRYASEAEMFDLIHQMRARIIKAPAFSGDKVLGAILFEMTMEREIAGKPSATFLWENKQVVPFLKVDKGLAEAQNGCQLMKPITGLGALLERAVAAGIFGTKMRSVIGAADKAGIRAVVDQQFDIAAEIIGHGLVPIIEPEVTISIPDKAQAEAFLRDEIARRLDALDADARVMLKLTLPSEADHYAAEIANPKVVRVVALSGGYSRAEAVALLAQNHGMIASFSRALTEGLNVAMSDAEFDAALAAAIDEIYRASIT